MKSIVLCNLKDQFTLEIYQNAQLCIRSGNIHERYTLQHDALLTIWHYGPLTRYIKLRDAPALGMPGTFPSTRAPLVSDPDMHHGTCVTHVPCCGPGSLTNGVLWSRWRNKNVPGIPGACATRNYAHLISLWLDFGKQELRQLHVSPILNRLIFKENQGRYWSN